MSHIRAERPATSLPSVAELDGYRTRFWRDALRRRMLATADTTVVLGAALAVYFVGHNTLGAVVLALALPLFVVAAKLCGLYDLDHQSLRHLTIDELPRVALWALASTAALTVLAWAFRLNLLTDGDRISTWLILILGGLTLRALARRIWRGVTPPERVVVIGDSPLADSITRKFDLFRDMHAQVSHQYDVLDPQDLDASAAWLEGVDRVVVASSSIDEDVIASLLPLCRQRQIKLSILPPARTIFGTTAELDRVAELPVIEYHTWDVSRTTLLGKRILDVLVSSLALVILLPFLFVIAVAVRLTSRGPSFFVQTRAGRNGKPFRMVKFRTMRRDAEERLSEVVDLDALDEPVFKIVGDPRITPLGHLLRRWSIDEVPQLWNVCKGDMSLVGPRPEQVDVVERYLPEHQFRLSIKPGMTGAMQVSGRGNLTFEERLAVERDYVENPTLSRDLRIVALTLSAVLRGDGAY